MACPATKSANYSAGGRVSRRESQVRTGLGAGGRWIRTFGSRTRHQAVRPRRGRFPVIGSSPHWPGGTGISNLRPLAGWISALERGRFQGHKQKRKLKSVAPSRGTESSNPSPSSSESVANLTSSPCRLPVGSRIPLRKGVHPTSFNPRSSPTHRKSGAASLHPYIIPRAVVLDPAVTVHTPEWLFLSAGVRAVDHCVEEAVCRPRCTP